MKFNETIGKGARLAVMAGLSATLALGGVVAPVTVAFAATNATITVNSPSGVTLAGKYKVYQLFTGDYANGGSAMSNAVANTAFRAQVVAALTATGADYKPAVNATDADLLDKVVAVGKASLTQTFAGNLAKELAKAGAPAATSTVDITNGSASYTGETGYYLLVSDTDNLGENESATSAILVPLGNAGKTVTSKAKTPTLEKKIKDNDGTWDGSYKDSADAGLVGNKPIAPTYQLTGTLPANIDEYKTYVYKFVDTMPKGFTTNADEVTNQWNVSVKINGTDLTSAFTATVSTDGRTVTWATDDLKAAAKTAGFTGDLASAKVVLEYTPVFDSADVEAIYGHTSTITDPQINSANLEFSNNPYSQGQGETGKTPEDETYLYSFNLNVNKVDDKKQPLAGAEFTLTNDKGEVVGKNITTGNAPTTFTFTGLESEVEYTLTETKTPAGMKTIKPVKFTLAVEKDSTTGKVTGIKVDNKVIEGNSAKLEVSATDKGTLDATVVNVPGDELPGTGAAGITAGVVLGGALITVSAVKIARDRKADSK